MCFPDPLFPPKKKKENEGGGMLPITLDKGKMSKGFHLTGELGTMDGTEGRVGRERVGGREHGLQVTLHPQCWVILSFLSCGFIQAPCFCLGASEEFKQKRRMCLIRKN